MKKIVWLGVFTVLIMAQCASNKNMDLANYKNDIVSEKTDTVKGRVVKTQIKILPGKHFVWKKDGIGKWYPVTENADGFAISVSKRIDLQEPLPDSGMAYTVLFNLPEKIQESEYTDSDLQKINAYSGFMAFHPEAGYRPAKKGKIAIRPDLKNHKLYIDIQLEGKFTKEINGEYAVDLK